MFLDDIDDSYSNINSIFEKITEYYEEPIKLGSRCQTNHFYRVEDLSEKDLDVCAKYISTRIRNTIAPQKPQLFLKLPGGHTFFAERLYAIYSEMYPQSEEIAFEQFSDSKLQNGNFDKYKDFNTILISDIITTAKSTLTNHAKITLRGIPVLCWVSLIDRTFGPGPVSVVSAFTGGPVRLLDI